MPRDSVGRSQECRCSHSCTVVDAVRDVGFFLTGSIRYVIVSGEYVSNVILLAS